MRPLLSSIERRGGFAVLLGLAALGASNGGAQPPSAEAELTLTTEQLARLEELGWPPPRPRVREPDDDVVERRGGEPVFGALQSLHAFALVSTPTGDVRVPRTEVGFVLLNGELIPAGAYVEVSLAWADTIRAMARLTAEAGRLTFEAEEMALNIAVQERRLEGC